MNKLKAGMKVINQYGDKGTVYGNAPPAAQAPGTLPYRFWPLGVLLCDGSGYTDTMSIVQVDFDGTCKETDIVWQPNAFSASMPPVMPGMTCYQCEAEVKWLAPDSRCKDCTRLTPEEVRGQVSLESGDGIVDTGFVYEEEVDPHTYSPAPEIPFGVAADEWEAKPNCYGKGAVLNEGLRLGKGCYDCDWVSLCHIEACKGNPVMHLHTMVDEALDREEIKSRLREYVTTGQIDLKGSGTGYVCDGDPTKCIYCGSKEGTLHGRNCPENVLATPPKITVQPVEYIHIELLIKLER